MGYASLRFRRHPRLSSLFLISVGLAALFLRDRPNFFLASRQGSISGRAVKGIRRFIIFNRPYCFLYRKVMRKESVLRSY